MAKQSIGSRIQKAREARSLTPGQLANRLGILAKTVKNWEADKSEPRANSLVSLAGVLGVSVGWLILGEKSDGAKGGGRKVKLNKTSNIERKLKTLVSLHERTSKLLFEVQSEITRLQSDIDKKDQ